MEKSSFFNSIAGDRLYNAQSFADYFNSLVTNGIFLNPSTNLQVLIDNNMSLTVKMGKAWINGYMYINDGDLPISLDNADGILKRIDRIVVQYSIANREIKVKIKKGTNASSPTAPVLQRDTDIYELGIADVLVTNGATVITQANITDLRLNTALCGAVNSLIQADTTAIFNQYQAWYTAKQNTYDEDFTSWTTEKQSAYDLWYSTTITTEQSQIDAMETQFQSDWDTWFASIQSALAGDVAGNLLAKIDAVPQVYRGTTEPTSPTNIDFWFQEVI